MRIEIVLCCGFLLASCQTTQVATDQAEAVSDGWQPGEMRITPPRSTIPQLQIGPYRRGTTPDGLAYRYYADGSGSVAFTDQALSGWSIRCNTDAMSDQRECSVSSDAARLLLIWRNGKPSATCVFSHDFPGRSAQIRIDSQPPITLPGACITANLSGQLAAGAWVVTRHYKWPSDIPRDQSAALKGLSSAIDLMKWIEKSKPQVL